MRKNIILLFSLILFTGLSLVLPSCEEDEQVLPFQEPTPKPLVSFEDENLGDPTRLGKKLENPYGLTKMREALVSLKEKNLKRGKTYSYPILNDAEEIQTTELYVKFIVKSIDDVERLEEDSLFLSEVPLDYEIAEVGDYFQNPEAEIQEEKWLYSAVPNDYTFPEDIRYEILAQLFLTEPANLDSNEDELANTRSILGKQISIEFLDDLEDEALLLTGNYTEPEGDESNKEGLEKRRRKKRPKGTIKVQNTFTRSYDPVQRVRVKTRRWFKFGKAWTNSNGFYSINRRYRRKINYKIKFKNSLKFRIQYHALSLKAGNHKAKKRSPAGYSVNLNRSQKAWRLATVNNATVQYIQYCNVFRIGKPHKRIRIVASKGKRDQRSSAPMLSKMKRMPSSGVLAFLKVFNINIKARLVWRLVRFATPDVIIKTYGKNTQRVYEETFHELGHASHFQRAGSRYWEKFVSQIVTNFLLKGEPYGNGQAKNDGYIDVGEMWGNYVSERFLSKKFGGLPFYPSVGINRWIQSQRMAILEIEATYSMREIYSALRSHVNSRCALRNELVRSYGKNIIKVGQILCPQNNTLR